MSEFDDFEGFEGKLHRSTGESSEPQAAPLEPLPDYFQRYTSALLTPAADMFTTVQNVLAGYPNCSSVAIPETNEIFGMVIMSGRMCKFLISLFSAEDNPSIENKSSESEVGGAVIEFCRKKGCVVTFSSFYNQCLAEICAALSVDSINSRCSDVNGEEHSLLTKQLSMQVPFLEQQPSLEQQDSTCSVASTASDGPDPLLFMTSSPDASQRVEAWAALANLICEPSSLRELVSDSTLPAFIQSLEDSLGHEVDEVVVVASLVVAQLCTGKAPGLEVKQGTSPVSKEVLAQVASGLVTPLFGSVRRALDVDDNSERDEKNTDTFHQVAQAQVLCYAVMSLNAMKQTDQILQCGDAERAMLQECCANFKGSICASQAEQLLAHLAMR